MVDFVEVKSIPLLHPSQVRCWVGPSTATQSGSLHDIMGNREGCAGTGGSGHQVTFGDED